jgi:ankyrin repeat protein
LAAGAKVDTVVVRDETALIAASRKGRLDVVRFLVEQKADVNLGVTTLTGQRRTPLNQAASPQIKSYLIEHGARNGR